MFEGMDEWDDLPDDDFFTFAAEECSRLLDKEEHSKEEQHRRLEQITRIVEDNIDVWRELAKYD